MFWGVGSSKVEGSGVFKIARSPGSEFRDPWLGLEDQKRRVHNPALFEGTRSSFIGPRPRLLQGIYYAVCQIIFRYGFSITPSQLQYPTERSTTPCLSGFRLPPRAFDVKLSNPTGPEPSRTVHRHDLRGSNFKADTLYKGWQWGMMRCRNQLGMLRLFIPKLEAEFPKILGLISLRCDVVSWVGGTASLQATESDANQTAEVWWLLRLPACKGCNCLQEGFGGLLEYAGSGISGFGS